jgi:hypothetical protein
MHLHKSWSPGDASKCLKANKQEAFTELCICSCRDMSKDHSTTDSWLLSPTKQTKLKKKQTLCKQQGATNFLSNLSISRRSFSFLCNKSYLVCWPCCLTSQSAASRANSLAHSGKNSQHRPASFLVTMKGHFSWTKVSMTEHQTSRSLPKVRLWASGTLLYTPAGENPLLRTSQKQMSLCHSPCLFLCSCLPGGLSHHSIKPIAPSQLWLHGNSGSGGVFSAPFLQVETEPGVDSDTPYATLEEACLVWAPSILLPPVSTPFCQRQWPDSADFVWLTVFQYHLCERPESIPNR